MQQSKLACITLDLENDWYFDDPAYDHLTFEYIDDYITLISDLNIPVSIFVVGETLEQYPKKVEQLQRELNVEFHLHSYRHDNSKSVDFGEEIELGTRAFESFFGIEPIGYRAQQGNINMNELLMLDDYGFKFDSSIFPSYRPGVYNNLNVPLSPYRPDKCSELVEIPFAAVPYLRIPISQSYLKLLGEPYIQYIKRTKIPNILVFDSHLQDFYQTASHNNLDLPLRIIHKRNLDRSTRVFRRLIAYLRESGYNFTKMSTIYDRVFDKI